ncbi:terminase large subunit [Promicromonospora kroppenstedtii]|uniref:terminase large subunit n=1 Tax=Promicromonospora kroppenstedtii TaxID=440482 RepID=UPI0004AC82AE|nr:terminase large subunit [Promicromonospora kroppenstedtii]
MNSTTSSAPRLKWAPARRGMIADDIAKRTATVGLTLDDWQIEVLRDALSVTMGGMWKTPRVACSIPRQNGKGAIIEAIELGFLLGAFPDAKLLVHSAHEFKTAKNGFDRILSLCRSHPALRKAEQTGRLVVKTANAQESLSFDGRTIKFFARSKNSGRGFSADLLILDEAQELSEDTFAAILPTISARPNPQIWLFGTPPSPTMNGEVFTRLREVALKEIDERLAYFEWSADKDDPIDDEATWRRANPACPGRISIDTIRDEFFSMDEETFSRERLGMWDGLASLAVIPEDTWAALAGESDPEGRVVFAIDVSPDRGRASIGVAGWLADGRVMVQAIENRKGTGWLAPRLKELTDRWPHQAVIVDSGGAGAALLPDLKRLRVRRVQVISTRDVVAACGGFYDLAMGVPQKDKDGNDLPALQRLSHPDQPVLNEALASARKRPLGDAWAWHRKDTATDITPLVAVTFAAYGLSLKPARPESSAPRRVVVMS